MFGLSSCSLCLQCRCSTLQFRSSSPSTIISGPCHSTRNGRQLRLAIYAAKVFFNNHGIGVFYLRLARRAAFSSPFTSPGRTSHRARRMSALSATVTHQLCCDGSDSSSSAFHLYQSLSYPTLILLGYMSLMLTLLSTRSLNRVRQP